MKIRIPQFTQTNLVAILNRADNILLAIKELGTSPQAEEAIITALMKARDPGDDWEYAALALVNVELLERRIRAEDPQVESYPADWNGGLVEGKGD